MLKLHLCGRSNRHHNLVSRVQLICDNHNVSLLKYVFDNTYANHCKSKIKAFKTSDGVVDSAAHLLTDFTPVSMAFLMLLEFNPTYVILCILLFYMCHVCICILYVLYFPILGGLK